MQIALYLGAHRTGSTYIQTQLQNCSSELLACGVKIVPLERVRDSITREVSNPWLRLLKPGFMRKNAILGFLRREADKGVKRIVVSDENLLGSIHGIFFNKDFYPNLQDRLSCLAANHTEFEISVFLAVRSYEWFFSSAYAHAIKTRDLPDFNHLKTRLLSFKRGWGHVVSDLRILFPNSKITVWTHEEFRKNEWRIFNEILGFEWLRQNPSNSWWANSSPSWKAIKEIMAKRRIQGDVSKAEVDTILAAYPKGDCNPGFHPWNSSEKQVLKDRHQKDIRNLETLCDRFFGDSI